MDAILSLGKMKDVTITGYSQSEIEEYAKAAAQK